MQTSLVKINRMYQTLNEIVQEQGVTLNKIEENCAATKQNTKKTVSELHTALGLEKSRRLCGQELSVVCLGLWFAVAMLFFMVDFLL